MAFLGTLIGAFIGVSGAFGVQWYLMRKNLKVHREEERKRKKYILEILKGEIEHNVQLLNQIKKEYQQPSWIGYYNLDTSTKQAVWSELIKMEGDAKFVYDLSRTYYEYEHMNRKLDFQLHHAADAVLDASVAQLRNAIIGGILSHTHSLLSGSNDRLREIKERLNFLS